MSILIDKTGFAAHIHKCLMNQASLPDGETDGMRMIQLLSGIMVETLLLFDEPDQGLSATYARLAQLLGSEPTAGVLGANALPPAYVIESETEIGRALARRLFEDWLNCAYDFHDLLLTVIQGMVVQLELCGQPRSETFRLFIECTNRCMGYEIAAQELCDIVIEEKIGAEGWNLADSVSGLSAVAGRCLAMGHTPSTIFNPVTWNDRLDQVSYVMTQEAVRLGIPAGSDWRFGLAANDCPANAPYDLIVSLEPSARGFFRIIGMMDLMDQAVACAKAAGRMLAVAAGGDAPELEPVIAKPLAMAAMTETYRSHGAQGYAASAQ